MSNTKVMEEYEDNAPTGVEAEADDETVSVARSWDASKIRIDAKMFSLRNILDLIKEGDLDLAPDFQRRNVWKTRQKCRLIESIFLRIPLPAFYFSSADDGSMQVVDGVQRLSAVRDFAAGAYRLQGLEYLQEVEGKRFAELVGTPWSRRFNSTQVVANVIDPQTPDQVKFDIFKRINTGGSPLNAQEIRHCMSQKRSRDFLKELTELPSFDLATGGTLRNHVRMVDREVALRFCAFSILGINVYGQSETMDAFLTDATKQIDRDLKEDNLAILRDRFDVAMSNGQRLFDGHAFRKWPLNSDDLNPLNRALFEVWSVTLAKYAWDALAPYTMQIVSAARKLMTDDNSFIGAISTSTGDPNRVVERFGKVSDLIGGIAS